MTGTKTLKLGGDKFTVAAMNLGQLEAAMPLILGLRAPSGPDTVAPQVGKLLNVLQIGISEAHPDVDLRKCTASLDELKAAFNDLMAISGFAPKAATPGEAPARVKSTSRRSAKS